MDSQNQLGITILGLGPGNANLLTLEAAECLKNAGEVYLRTKQHPTLEAIAGDLVIRSFDELYDRCESFEQVYEQIIQTIIELGQRPEGVVYAVPGHPYVAEATSPEIIRRARFNNIPYRVIEGLSFIEPVFTILDIDPFPQILLIDALELGIKAVPPYSPNVPVVISQIYSKMVANEVKLTLGNILPDDYQVRLVHNAGAPDCVVEDLHLYEIDRSDMIGLRTVLYVPPLPDEASFEAFQEIVAQLRAPDGCPWDRKQTHKSLRQFLLEESYELLEALDQGDTLKIAEELGDLLLQIILHAQIAVEEGEFNMTDVLTGIYRKIVRRHPHVFGTESANNSDEVIQTWERIKEEERKSLHPENKPTGLLVGVPGILPALSQAQEIQNRAARVGFDWDQIKPVYDKVREEIEEVLQAVQQTHKEAEIGDLLFSVVNLSRWLQVDSEAALREANNRFRKRFSYIENETSRLGKRMNEMSFEEMDIFWEQAKKLE